MKKQDKSSMESLLGNILLTTIIATVIMLGFCVVLYYLASKSEQTVAGITGKVSKPEIEELFLTPNQYSRPQKELKKVKGIVIHYTANPGSSAEANRNYFEGLRKKKKTYASSHFVVGLEGEIVQCIPLDEISYASNDRNVDTISIECCHEDNTGKFNEKTYESVIRLVAWLCGEYNLSEDDIIRHYDVTGKMCPKYFVKHKKAWKKLKKDVFAYIEEEQSDDGKEK